MKSRIGAVAPARHRAATPYLVVKDTVEAIEFYRRAFGATQVECVMCHGHIGQAEIRIGTSRVRLSDEYPETGLLSPKSFGGSPARVVLRAPDADQLVGKAVAIGAKLRGRADRLRDTGRADSLEDPFGHIWDIAIARKGAATVKTVSTRRRSGR